MEEQGPSGMALWCGQEIQSKSWLVLQHRSTGGKSPQLRMNHNFVGHLTDPRSWEGRMKMLQRVVGGGNFGHCKMLGSVWHSVVDWGEGSQPGNSYLKGRMEESAIKRCGSKGCP